MRSPIWARSLVAACLAVALLWMILGAGEGRFKSLIECLGFFFSGIVLHRLFVLIKVPSLAPWLASILEISSLVWVFLAVSGVEKDTASRWNVAFAFWGVILLFSNQSDGGVSRVLRAGVFQKLGELSYSVYMVHALILSVAFNLVSITTGLDIHSMEGGGSGLVFSSASLLNGVLLAIVVLCSMATYRWGKRLGGCALGTGR